MCGIIGGINIQPKNSENILASIAHRGPDGEGLFYADGIFLGHTRLSIQDLSEKGHQPMFSSDNKYVIIFNGEIYNHWEIRKKLEKKYSFKSSSDTETLLYGYIEFGKEILKLLNGIYVFAIYDVEAKNIIIARDPMGVKPFYYYQDIDKILFSSELKSFQSFEFKKNISVEALANYLTFLWSPGDQTPFKYVKKLEPGHLIELNLQSINSIQPEKFYQINFKGEYFGSSENEIITTLEQKLTNAVERQMLSDVPLGFFLSGGLDSSLLVAIARKLYPNKRIDCFTIETSEMENEGFVNDLHYAKKVADYLDVNLHIVKADIDIVRDFDKMIWHLDEPQADAAPLNVLNICREARELGIKVLISGTAGDDLFSGYKRHKALIFESWMDKIPYPLRYLGKKTFSVFPSSHPFFRRIKKLTVDWDKEKIQRMSGYFAWYPIDKIRELFTVEQRRNIGNYEPTKLLEKLNEDIPDEHNILNQMLYWELKSFLVDHNLNYTDKLSMAVGVEVRVPFLDLELVEFSTKIAPNLKLKEGETKYILKKVAEKYLPKEVIYRPKTGFGAPVRKWITENMSDMIEEKLRFDRLREIGILNPDSIWKLINDNKSGKIDASYTIWCLLAIESWIRQFVENKPYYDTYE